jgi:hypothetical protein
MASRRELRIYIDSSLCKRFESHMGQGWSLSDVIEGFVKDAMAQAVEQADVSGRMVLTPDEMRRMRNG